MTNIITTITSFFTNLTNTELCIFIGLSLLLIINTVNYIKSMLSLGGSDSPREFYTKRIIISIIIQIISVATLLYLFTNTGIIDLIINNFITNILLLSLPFFTNGISKWILK